MHSQQTIGCNEFTYILLWSDDANRETKAFHLFNNAIIIQVADISKEVAGYIMSHTEQCNLNCAFYVRSLTQRSISRKFETLLIYFEANNKDRLIEVSLKWNTIFKQFKYLNQFEIW